jgi:diguanylate cyclase (GGDEF)-like protein
MAAVSQRKPRYSIWARISLVGLFLLALAATGIILAIARSAVERNGAQFRDRQTLRLTRAARASEDFLGDAVQLVNASADTLGGVRNDRVLASRLLTGLLRSRSSRAVYGMGVFYGPHVFDNASELFGLYDVAGPTLRRHVHTERDYQYTGLHWYTMAMQARGHVAFVGPYTESRVTYVSAVRAFYRSGRLAGVATVDTLASTFARIMLTGAAPGDVAYVRLRDGSIALKTGPIDGRERIEAMTPLRYTHATLRFSTDARALFAANRRVETASALAIAATWALSVLFGLVMLRSWKARDIARGLEEQRLRLQQEIETSKQIEVELRHAAYTDALTGLPNRTPFLEAVSSALSKAGSGLAKGVFFIDLDRFNAVNDTLGHFAGDELLRAVAVRLRSRLPQEALVARLGGDEFLVLMGVEGGVGRSAQQLLDVFREPLIFNERVIYVAASIGVTVIDAHYSRAEELLRDADIAMYQAKQAGRGRYALFDGTMGSRVARESALENNLRRAIRFCEFVAYYQPIVQLPGEHIASFEALIRWNQLSGPIEACEFVPFAERLGLIGEIDALVRDRVLQDAPLIFERYPGTSVSINLSATELGSPQLLSDVSRMLACGIPPSNLKFEITETAIMTDAVHSHVALERLRELGVEIVLDDFGQGHSSLAYLRQLPISGVKIDQSFIKPLGTDKQAEAIVRSIVALAETLNFYTVAEGVETASQLASVGNLGVTFAQGFFFSPALSLARTFEFSFPVSSRSD